jgi:hypothetical protein
VQLTTHPAPSGGIGRYESHGADSNLSEFHVAYLWFYKYMNLVLARKYKTKTIIHIYIYRYGKDEFEHHSVEPVCLNA